MHTTTVQQLQNRLKRSTFSNDGDDFERQFGRLVTDRFPRLECFWQQCIVPLTTRINQEPGLLEKLRTDVCDDVRLMSYAHYTAFLHLLYACFRYTEMQSCLKSRISPFGGFYAFYAHLGSACDIVEEFLFRLHAVVLQCSGQQPEAKELLNEWETTGKRSKKDWRHKKLDAYFGDSRSWHTYKKFTKELRPYRNVIVHAVAMGASVDPADWTHRIPKKEKIRKYSDLIPVLDASREAVKRDFVPMQQQAQADLAELGGILNRVWRHPLVDLSDLLYRKRNTTLLAKYQIAFT